MNKLPRVPNVGVAVLVIQNNKILLGERISKPGNNTWQVPGGHLEYRETPYECAKRELLEETNLISQDVSIGPWTNDIFEEEKKHYVTLYMVVTRFQGELKVLEPDKCKSWKFFDFDNLPAPLFLPLKNFLKRHSFKDFFLNSYNPLNTN